MERHMTENELERCQLQDKTWKCPECNKLLARKQTLKSHLRVMHKVQGGLESKRYKHYEYTGDGDIPKSTLYRWKKVISSDEPVLEGACEKPDEEPMQVPSETRSETAIDNDSSCYYKEGSQEPSEGIADDYEIVNYDVIDMELSDDSNTDLDEDEEENSDSEGLINKCNVECLQQDESPPIYIFPDSGSSNEEVISHLHHMLSICAYSTAHNLSGVAVQDLLTLIKLHVPTNNICETKLHELKEKCGFNDSNLKYFDYCSKCTTLFPEDTNVETCIMPECGTNRFSGKEKVKNIMFVTNYVKSQLTDVLKRKGNWDHVMTEHGRPTERLETISDITSGAEYKKLYLPGGFLDKTKGTNITLTWNTDGIPLFKSSSVSLWPVFLTINELPPKERYLRKNVILWGVWQGTSKPPMNTFLYQFVKDASTLYHEGFTFEVNDQTVHCHAMVLTGTMDLQARAYVLNTTQHNGSYSCLYCEEEGKVVKSGAGHCRSYTFPSHPVIERTSASFLKNAEDSSVSGKPVMGVLGPSVVTHLPEFSPNNVVIDYMHGILLGITKKLLSLWIDGKSYDKEFFIGHQVKILDKSLVSLKPPYLISRLPRKTKNNFNKWKASELRSWLLFYSLPCIKGILPQIYLEHFSCLVEGTYILLKEEITAEDLMRADVVFRSFYQNAAILYGDSLLGLNVHNLYHLTSCVRKWGPLWAWSCFGFESCNGEILRTVHGKGNVCSQLFWNMQAQKRLELEINSLPPGQVKDFYQSQLRSGSKQYPAHENAYQCDVVLPIHNVDGHNQSEEIESQLKDLCNLQHIEHDRFGTSNKVIRNGCIFYSKNCSKVKKRNSYTALLEVPLSDGANVVQVRYYFVDMVTMKVFAVCSTFSTTGPVIAGRAPHIQVLKKMKENVVISTANLKELLVYMPLGGKDVVARFPNFVERD